MKIDLNKVVCIDLMKWNDQLIKEYAEYFGMDGDVFIKNKKNGVKKYYFSPELKYVKTGFYGGDDVIAIEFTENPKVNKGGDVTKHNLKLNLPFTTKEIKKLRSIEPFDFVKFRKEKNIEAAQKRKAQKQKEFSDSNNTSVSESKITNVILDLDTILDKISKLGVDSLTKKEKDFLDGL